MHTYTSWNNYELQRNLKTRTVNDTFWHYLKHLEMQRTRSLNKVCILTLFKTAMRKMIYVFTKSRLNITHPLDLLVWIQQLTWMCQTSNKIIKSMKYVAASYLGRWYIGKDEIRSCILSRSMVHWQSYEWQWQHHWPDIFCNNASKCFSGHQ